MNLSVMSYCTKHGIWQSASKEIKVIGDKNPGEFI
jgi:hypothetical protein